MADEVLKPVAKPEHVDSMGREMPEGVIPGGQERRFSGKDGHILAAWRSGMEIRRMGRCFHVGKTTIYRALRRCGVSPGDQRMRKEEVEKVSMGEMPREVAEKVKEKLGELKREFPSFDVDAAFTQLVSPLLRHGNYKNLIENPKKLDAHVVEKSRLITALMLGAITETKINEAPLSALVQAIPTFISLAKEERRFDDGRASARVDVKQLIINITAAAAKVKKFNPELAEAASRAIKVVEAHAKEVPVNGAEGGRCGEESAEVVGGPAVTH